MSSASLSTWNCHSLSYLQQDQTLDSFASGLRGVRLCTEQSGSGPTLCPLSLSCHFQNVWTSSRPVELNGVRGTISVSHPVADSAPHRFHVVCDHRRKLNQQIVKRTVQAAGGKERRWVRQRLSIDNRNNYHAAENHTKLVIDEHIALLTLSHFRNQASVHLISETQMPIAHQSRTSPSSHDTHPMAFSTYALHFWLFPETRSHNRRHSIYNCSSSMLYRIHGILMRAFL